MKRINYPCAILVLLFGLGLTVAHAEPVFGPQTFERTACQSDLYTEVFLAPIAGEFMLFMRNGDGEVGLVTSATVLVNGSQLLGPADFSEGVPGLARAVELHAGANMLTVELAGDPGSYVTLAIAPRTDRLVMSHGRLLMPWGVRDPDHRLVLTLKNGSLHFPRAFRIVFFAPTGEVAAVTPRLGLPPRCSIAVPVDELLGGATWEGGSIELFYAGRGTSRMFGSSRQADLSLGQIEALPLEPAGHRVFRGPARAR